ncbi:MAG: MurR/RpiR family transcriptional regulator [Sarcina sp.]
MNYITQIQSCYLSLSKTEKKIAEYVLAQKGQIIYQTLTEISKTVKVGEATIIRLVKKLGFKGFQNFKLEIAKEYSVNESQIKASYESYIDESQANMASIIESTKLTLNKKELDLAIDLIMNAKKIFFYGVSASALTAQEAQNRFLRIGVLGVHVEDSHLQMMCSAVAGDEDLIIAFSLSGDTKDIVEALSEAKNNNVKIIAITSYALSEITKFADCVILTAKKESPLDGGSLLGRVSQMYILDLLCTGYFLKNKEKSILNKNKVANALISKNIYAK